MRQKYFYENIVLLNHGKKFGYFLRIFPRKLSSSQTMGVIEEILFLTKQKIRKVLGY